MCGLFVLEVGQENGRELTGTRCFYGFSLRKNKKRKSRVAAVVVGCLLLVVGWLVVLLFPFRIHIMWPVALLFLPFPFAFLSRN
jgi:hypothetical protein